ncbi:UDP-N-acetylmuramoyl-L-alanine--D-glutamate ligase [Inquilinus sp. CAU 1745]|uniref:UDP-N-acetylmuramoyl-L-alanine--D-glutamate ligase n=1 Tax=Inquilinus sp. CAU 1745 TaxID=3140369 RepID=UPI00325A9A86
MTGIDLSFLEDRTVAILGLGKSGLTAAKALKASGVRVVAWDDGAPARAAAEAAGIPTADPANDDFARADMLVLSPGIPRRHPAPHPAVAAALARGAVVANDIDLLGMVQAGANWLGVTGTNGKSTTTALIGHLLKETGIRAEVGGNLGTPALALAPLGPEGWYVLELSSYQLETVSAVRWDVGVLLNVTADHLDRYAGMDDYVAAKAKLFAHQPTGAVAIIGIDDDWCRGLHETLAKRPNRRAIAISSQHPVPGGVHAVDGKLIDDLDGKAAPVADLRAIPTLPGAHNWQNAAAAYAAIRSVGVPADRIAAALKSFPGLAHRQELVATIDGVRFVNDSKATNADAAAKALGSYDRIYWIAGGKPKPGGLEALDPWLDRIAHAYLIGEGAEKFAGYLGARVPHEISGDLETAVRAAAARARRDGARNAVVLLSPACASFDQFANFEERGRAFATAVNGLTEGGRTALAGGGR